MTTYAVITETVLLCVLFHEATLLYFPAQTIWEIGCDKDNPVIFTSALEDSELKEFGFTQDFTFDLWGAISDAKAGRLKKTAEFPEAF